MASLLESSNKRPGSLHFGQRRTGIRGGGTRSYTECNDDVNRLCRDAVSSLACWSGSRSRGWRWAARVVCKRMEIVNGLRVKPLTGCLSSGGAPTFLALALTHLDHHVLELPPEFFGMFELLPRLPEERVHLSAFGARHPV